MVKSHFHYKQARYLFIAWIIIGLSFTIFVLVSVNVPRGWLFGIGGSVFSSGSAADPLLFILPLLVLSSGICLAGLLPHARQRERRRQIAAVASLTDMRILSADEQPVPDETALTLPCIIRQKPDLKRIFVISGLLVLLAAVPASMMILASTGIPGLSLLLVIVGIYLFFLFLLVGSLVTTSSSRIEVTNEGLLVRQGSDEQSIRWDEVRLFAIGPLGPKRGMPAMQYELASPTRMVRWLRCRRKRALLINLSKPAQPFDEYDRQMEALLAVIAAKTRLRLYDLR